MLCPLLLSSQTFSPPSFPLHIPQRHQIPLFSSHLKMKGRKAVFVYSLASYPPPPPLIQRESTKSLFSAYSKVQSCKKQRKSKKEDVVFNLPELPLSYTVRPLTNNSL